jgi:branched-chain amino acid transport system ATP-binding protein
MRLEVRDLDVRYGRVQAVCGVSLRVEPGEVVAVLGANGAGKSSLLKAVLGMERPAGGAVLIDGEDITRAPPSLRVRRGLVLVPEGRRIIMSLTVHDNLLSGGAAAPISLGAVRRRAADARHRPRLARQPQDHDAR